MSHNPQNFDEITSLFSASCPFVKLSVRQNVRSAKRPFGKTSVGKMSVRQNVFRQSVFRKNVRVLIKLNPERIKWERVLPNFGLGDGVYACYWDCE